MFDLVAAGSVPPVYGHLYQSSEYLDAWLGATQPDGWTEADTESLRDLLNQLDREAESK